jgi:predicted transcriptional regulator
VLLCEFGEEAGRNGRKAANSFDDLRELENYCVVSWYERKKNRLNREVVGELDFVEVRKL